MSQELTIKRINAYDDSRFQQQVLNQHGAFLVNDKHPFEVEIVGSDSAIIRGEKEEYYLDVIEEFRFFAEHITRFYDRDGHNIIDFTPVKPFKVEIKRIRPSQFWVSKEKKTAVKSFVTSERDIVIPLVEFEDGYIALDGHTRLSVAIDLGYEFVYGFLTESSEYVFDFANEAALRGIHAISCICELEHKEYIQKWLGFCEAYWSHK